MFESSTHQMIKNNEQLIKADLIFITDFLLILQNVEVINNIFSFVFSPYFTMQYVINAFVV